MIRAPRRQDERRLEDMTDAELTQVRFFGDVVADSGAVTFRATAGQKREAEAIMARRGRPIPAEALRPPDPRPVLDGPAGREQVEREYKEFDTNRADTLRAAGSSRTRRHP